MRQILSIIFLISILTTGTGQVNIKVGYALAKTSASQNNKILQAFNEKNSDILEKNLGDLGTIQGLVVGAQYKMGRNTIELSWEHMSTNREAVGETSSMTLFQQELFYSFNQLVFNFESSFGMFGIGTGIGYNRIKVKDKISTSDVKKTIVADNQAIARINLSFKFSEGSRVSFALKPYIQIPLSGVGLTQLASELEVDNVINKNESFPMFGISFIFYNGK